MSKSQRDKGAGGERELCALLTDALGVPVKRLLGQARDGGNDISLPPFLIECKRRKRIGNVYAWIEQASPIVVDYGAMIGSPIPVVALRADGKEWLVVMRLQEWIKLAREEISK